MPTFGASGSAVDPSTMDACATAIATQTCDQALDNAQPSACAVPGTLAAGAPCAVNAQCQSTYCKPTAGTACGTCTARSSAGQPCTADTDCAATLVCGAGTSGMMGACVGPAMEGAQCSAAQPCLRTLSCVGGTCQKPGQVGATCAALGDCDVGHGLYCDTNTKKCAQATYAMATQACGVVNGAAVACLASAQCTNIQGMQGTCHQTAGDGMACGPGIGCLPPAVCTTGLRCTLPNPASCH
jgi:hypothetical protein